MAAAVSFVHFREGPPTQTPARFQIALPENMSFTGGGAFAVSPDGRRLVFAAIGADNTPRLWLRSLNSLGVKQLQGGEIDPMEPTVIWSPDSRFVAFRTEQRLQKIDVAGGLTQTMCAGPECMASANLTGGSWNHSDTIVFSPGVEPHAVMRISANGGVPTIVTAPKGLHQGHSYPTFLPDGQHFLYARWSEVPDNRGIFVGSLTARPEDQDPRMLLRFDVPSAVSVYVPSTEESHSGELLFMRQRTLMAQHFEERRFVLSGEPTPVADGVHSNNIGTGMFSASANGVLVYRTGEGRIVKQIAWLDQNGSVSSTACEPGRYGTNMLRVSPDGTRALYTERDESKNVLAVWAADLVRGGNVRVTSGSDDSANPVWSPDGRRVAYGTNHEDSAAIYHKDSSGLGSEELLVKLDRHLGPPHPYDWTLDGRYLVYGVRDPKTKLDLWALPLAENGAARQPIPLLRSEFDELDARVSPDGRWIAYLSNESGRGEVYVQPFRVGSPPPRDKSEPSKWRISNGALGMPHWRRDGSELLYMSLDGAIMSVAITPGPTFPASMPRIVFRTPRDLFPLSVTPAMLVDPTSDHKRFLLLLPADRTKRDEFTVVLNWMAGLRREQ
jgi:Tol biopolymer transport system component